MSRVIAKFDQYIDSRISIILNWLWKSGLFILMIGLLFQNLNVQKDNSIHIIENSTSIRELLTDIKYLRRDVDSVVFPKRTPKDG